MTSQIDFQHIADFINSVFDETGDIARHYFRSGTKVTEKEDKTPVTIADEEIEHLMRDRIRAAFPDHGIIGEEHGVENEDAEYKWHIDPIDGTKAFVSGVPVFGTLMALEHKGEPVIGALDQAYVRDRWIGGAGFATKMNGKIVKTSGLEDISKATLTVTSPDYLKTFGPFYENAMAEMERQSKQHLYGTSCYASGLISMGCLDLILSAGLKSWDYMSRKAIIEGAGGVMTDWNGDAPKGHKIMIVASASKALHETALGILKKD